MLKLATAYKNFRDDILRICWENLGENINQELLVKKNSLFGLIFLISSFTGAVEKTEIPKPPNFTYLDMEDFFSVFDLTLPNGHDVQIVDDDGFASLAWALKAIQQGNIAEQDLLENIIDRSLEKLGQVKHSKDKVASVNHLINKRPAGRLEELKKFVETYKTNFGYLYYDEIKNSLGLNWHDAFFLDLGLISTNILLSSIPVTFENMQNINKSSQASLEVLSSEVTIEKSHDIKKQIVNAIYQAFPIFERMFTKNIGGCERKMSLVSKAPIDVGSIFNNEDGTLIPDEVVPKDTTPLYLIAFVGPSQFMSHFNYALWIFEVTPVLSTDDEHFTAKVTKTRRSTLDSNLVKKIFPNIDSFKKDINNL